MPVELHPTSPLPPSVATALWRPIQVKPPVQEVSVEADSALRDLASFLGRHYVALIAATVAGLVLAIVITKSQPRVYRAAAVLEIQDLNENFLNLENVTPLSHPQESYSTSDFQTQLRILQSNSLMERVVGTLPQEQVRPPSGASALLNRVRGITPKPPTRDDLVAQAARRLTVQESRQARIVDVTFDSEDPKYAATLVNTLARQYIDQSIEARMESSRGTLVWLSRQLDEHRGQLEAAQKRLQEYAHANRLLVISGDRYPAEERLRQIQEALAKAQEDRIHAQSRVETAVTAPLETVDGPAGNSLRDYSAKLTDLRRQRDDLMTVYTPEFEGIKRLDAQIRTLESATRSENATLLRGMQTAYTDALKREKLLNDQFDQQANIVSGQAESALQYGILKSELDTRQDLYDTMLQRAAEARVASAMRASNARIVDLAKVPQQPFRPSLLLNSMWGLTGGLLFGLVFSAGRDSFDRVRQMGNLGHHLRVPELGVLPAIASLQAPESPWAARLRKARGVQAPDRASEIALATWNRGKSPLADSIRGIVASILFSNPARIPQVVAVVSTTRGEGKTTLATNIAAALSQAGRRVLLIDGNLREPRLHSILDQPNNFGFADLVTLPGSHKGALSYVTNPTPLPNVWLASPGPLEYGALELLYSPNMAALMSQAREDFDLVLIDTPALDDVPDGRILGRIADGVILVAQAGAADKDTALKTAERLQQDGVVVLGTVLNHWTR